MKTQIRCLIFLPALLTPLLGFGAEAPLPAGEQSTAAAPAQTAEAQAAPEALFPPELVLFFGDQINLSTEQRLGIRTRVEAAQPEGRKYQEALDRESAAFSKLVHQTHIDEKELQKQLDAVLDAERGLKQIHLGTMAAIKNMLTPEQQQKLAELAKNQGGLQEETRLRLTAKAERFKTGLKQMQENGRDPAAIGSIMKDFEPLVKSGKLTDAEAILDRALKAIDEANK